MPKQSNLKKDEQENNFHRNEIASLKIVEVIPATNVLKSSNQIISKRKKRKFELIRRFLWRCFLSLKKIVLFLHRKNQESIIQHKRIQKMLEEERTNYLHHIRWR
jgi:hypothetical protein